MKTNVSTALVLTAIGIYLTYWALTQPCTITPITQTAGTETITITTPQELDKIVCLTTNYKLAIALLGGTILAWAAGSRLIDGVIDK